MKKRLINLSVFILILIIPFCFVSCTVENGSNKDLKSSINLALRSSVVIETSGASDGTGGTAGSGVIYKINGNDIYIITNWHVICKNIGIIEPANTIVISPANVKTWAGDMVDPSFQTLPEYMVLANVIGGSVTHDIAILKATATPGYISRFSLKETKFAEYDGAVYGDTVFAVGNSLGIGLSATEGIISVASEYRLGSNLTGGDPVLRRLIRTTAATQQGNSGGGLFNEKAELVGILQSKTMYYGYEEGYPEASGYPADNMAYVVPINVAGRIADQIFARYNGQSVVENLIIKSLGVEIIATNFRNVVGSDGVNNYYEDAVVSNVVSTTNIGLIKDDIILSINCGGLKEVVNKVYLLNEFLIDCWNQNNVTIEVKRGTQTLTLSGNFAN